MHTRTRYKLSVHIRTAPETSHFDPGRGRKYSVYWSRRPLQCVRSTIDITVRDRKLKFPLNQNVLRDVTSRWSMRITARSSDY